MNPAVDNAFVQQLELYVVAAAFILARFGALMSVFPGFTRLGISGLLQGTIALAFALPVLPLIVNTLDVGQMTIGRMSFLFLKEAAVGAVIGLLLGLPLWAAEAAGDILDLQRGTTFAGLIDPSYTTETSVTGTLFAIAMIALFFVTGGLSVVLRTFYESYSLWPAGEFTPVFSRASGDLFLSMLDDIMSMGLMLAIPIVLAMLLADLSLALVARAAPHMHIFDLSLSVKNLVFTILLLLYGAFLVSYMEMDLRTLLSAKDKLQLIRGLPGG